MNPGVSPTSARGEDRPPLRFESLWKISLDPISSLITGNWLFHDWSVSYTYLYMTISSGSPSRSSHFLWSVASASDIYRSRMSIRFSSRWETFAATLSELPEAVFTSNERMKNPKARSIAIELARFFKYSALLIFGISFMMIRLSLDYCKSPVQLLCEDCPHHLMRECHP